MKTATMRLITAPTAKTDPTAAMHHRRAWRPSWRIMRLSVLREPHLSAPAAPDYPLAGLGDLGIHFSARHLPACDSTNSVLMDAPPPDDGRVHVVLTDRQTAGRGRRGRQWQSWQGGSLTFSALWRFDAGAPVPAGLSLVAGLALARTLEQLGVAGVQLKWPNDVLIHGAKLAGILVELLPGRGRTSAAVIGIGVNLGLPPAATIEGQKAVTDLRSELGRDVDRDTLLAALLRELHGLLTTYATAGFPALRAAWEQRNAFAGLPVSILGEAEAVQGTCIGVAEDGALLLQGEDGVRRILSGEVSLRAAP